MLNDTSRVEVNLVLRKFLLNPFERNHQSFFHGGARFEEENSENKDGKVLRSTRCPKELKLFFQYFHARIRYCRSKGSACEYLNSRVKYFAPKIK